MPKTVVAWGSKEIWIQGTLIRMACVDGEKYTSVEDPETALTLLSGLSKQADIFTFVQHPPDTQPRYDYYMEWDNFAVLPVSTFDYWWNSQIRSIGRNRARQAEKKGVVIREAPFGEELLQAIADIHNETPVRQGRRFPHYGMDCEGARRYAGTFLDRTAFLAAYFEGRIIGYLKLTFSDTARHACIVTVLSMVRHRDKAPSNALIAEAVRTCAHRGIPYLVYENFTYGRKKHDSLSQFKAANGFRQMDLPRYYLPLTARGRLGLRLGLHHRLAEYCPESLLERYRSLRRRWYAARFPQAAGTLASD